MATRLTDALRKIAKAVNDHKGSPVQAQLSEDGILLRMGGREEKHRVSLVQVLDWSWLDPGVAVRREIRHLLMEMQREVDELAATVAEVDRARVVLPAGIVSLDELLRSFRGKNNTLD